MDGLCLEVFLWDQGRIVPLPPTPPGGVPISEETGLWTLFGPVSAWLTSNFPLLSPAAQTLSERMRPLKKKQPQSQYYTENIKISWNNKCPVSGWTSLVFIHIWKRIIWIGSQIRSTHCNWWGSWVPFNLQGLPPYFSLAFLVLIEGSRLFIFWKFLQMDFADFALVNEGDQ